MSCLTNHFQFAVEVLSSICLEKVAASPNIFEFPHPFNLTFDHEVDTQASFTVWHVSKTTSGSLQESPESISSLREAEMDRVWKAKARHQELELWQAARK
jgi:hypothetical protein